MNAREQIAYLLWQAVPSAGDAEARAAAAEMLDAYRTKVLAKAIGRLRAIPVTCTALTGPVWYGDGWNSAIACLEDIADYQTPDDEAYPGELQRLRALALGLRVAALRKEDLAEVQRLLVVHAEHEMNVREKATASAATATPDFFQPGHTYTARSAPYLFHCVTHILWPDGSIRALGRSVWTGRAELHWIATELAADDWTGGAWGGWTDTSGEVTP